MKRSRMRGLLREPLLHFLLIGAGLFLVYEWRGKPAPMPGGQAGTPAAQIVVTQDDIDRMTTLFTKTWQRAPSEDERKALVEDFVRNEIYFREALAIGLDRDDEVLRRRLRQKMEFIYEDISSWVEPTDEELKAFMKKHPEKYLSDPQIAFRQVYIDATRRGARAEADARQVLARLATGTDPGSVGDSTMLPPEIPLSPLWDIKRQFGDEFGKSLLGIAPGKWAGPVRSGYGLHLVLVSESRGGRLRDLQEVRELVKQDWTFEKQKEVKDAAYAKIRERYTVTVEKPRPVAAAAAAAGKGGAKAR